MTTVVRQAEVAATAEPANNLHLRALVTARDFGPDISVTWVQLAGRHRRLRTERSTRVYAVLDGAITLQVGDDADVDLGPGDLAVVLRGCPYDFAGIGSYLVINAPAFVDGDDVYEPDRTR